MILELPTELESRIERAARARGTDAPSFIIEATRAAIEVTENGNATAAKTQAPALSPMESAVAYIKANPIRALGPIDAAADLEEVRAGQDR